MLYPLEDRECLQALYAEAPEATVHARSILYGRRVHDVRILVDDPRCPRAVALTHDGMCWDIYAPEPERGRALLAELEPGTSRAIFVGISPHLIPEIERRFEVLVHTPTDLLWLPDGARPPEPSAASRGGRRAPPPVDVQLGALGLEHAELVAAAWPHDDFEQPSGKLAYIRACITAGPTVAATHQGRLASFVLTHTDGSMGVLHTQPEHRGRGLGRLVLSTLVRTLLARGAPIFGFIVVGNAASTALVTSLGLRPVQRGAWLTVKC
jgi:ribosomal protein S18 acetylase RimI-like enzyme